MFLSIFYVLLFLTAIGFTPGGSSTVHTHTQSVNRIHRTYITIKREKLGSAGRALSLPVITWYLPYN
jgi:hypothetical protein